MLIANKIFRVTVVLLIYFYHQFVPALTGVQPHFQSWGSNSLVLVIVQNKRLVYTFSCTAT